GDSTKRARCHHVFAPRQAPPRAPARRLVDPDGAARSPRKSREDSGFGGAWTAARDFQPSCVRSCAVSSEAGAENAKKARWDAVARAGAGPYLCRTFRGATDVLRATPESPRMFESDFLDLFSRTHWSVVPIVWVPVALLMMTYSALRTPAGLAMTLLLAFLGFVAWTLTEYWLHRVFFHWTPPGRWGERMHFLVHGVHHTWPKDKYRLVMPPAVSLTLYFVFLALFYPIFGATYVWSWHAGFVLGYVFYDCTHYYLH